MSCRLVPSSTVTAIGTPLPSTSKLCFVPDLALSVGFGPVLFPPKRSLCHHTLSIANHCPIQSLSFHHIPTDHPPTFAEIHTIVLPFLKSVMYST